MLPVEATDQFKDWLQKKLDENDISMRDASLKAGLSDSRISQIMRGDPPGAEVLIKLADYFDEPRERVFYLAGYLKYDPTERGDVPVELLNFVRRLMQLSKSDRTEVISRLKPLLELALGRRENEK